MANKLESNVLKRLNLALIAIMIILAPALGSVSNEHSAVLFRLPAPKKPVHCSIDVHTERLSNLAEEVEEVIAPCVASHVLLHELPTTQPVSYEDLLYGNCAQGACLGARRYTQLSVPRLSIVTVNYCDSKFDDAQLNAAADTVAHLLLDLELKDAQLDSIVVPDDALARFIKKLGFYHIKEPTEAGGVSDTKDLTFRIINQSGTRSKRLQFKR